MEEWTSSADSIRAAAARPGLRLASAAATRRLGETLGTTAVAGDVLALSGPLGAGKTTLAQGLLAALGVTGRVGSPTFDILHSYDARLLAVHIDLYRLGGHSPELDDDAWLAEGLDEAELAIVEWPERLPGLLSADRLEVALERPFGSGDVRLARIRPCGERSAAWWRRVAAVSAAKPAEDPGGAAMGGRAKP